MSKESFMLVSLKGDKAKKLAQVMSNPTCIKILDYLAGKDSTESQISKDLNVPLSTVHYNLQQLVEAKLVIIEEFHYSEKGREVNHYKLANKYIIIAPKEDSSFLERLKHLIPVTVLTLGVAVVLKLMQVVTRTVPEPEAGLMMASAPMAEPAAGAMAKTAGDTAMEESSRMFAADMAADNITEKVTDVMQAVDVPMDAALPSPEQFVAPHTPWWQSAPIEWFLIGAVFVLAILVLAEVIRHWRWKREN